MDRKLGSAPANAAPSRSSAAAGHRRLRTDFRRKDARGERPTPLLPGKPRLAARHSRAAAVPPAPPSDYADRTYLSVGEVAAFTGLSVPAIHSLVKRRSLPAVRSAGGQYRFDLRDVEPLRRPDADAPAPAPVTDILLNGTRQQICQRDARHLESVPDDSVNLAVTSPPYFDAKMYSDSENGDLGNIHDLDTWFTEIGKVWAEVHRVLQPGRKFFLNIMNLPVRENKSFRTLNLVGRNITLCEEIGFVFKRDIIWHKTNGVRAHFGTYPYPGGILINNMHEFILEFEKPSKGGKKYGHVTDDQRDRSKLDKDFWLSVKNTDVWLIKPEKSGQNRSHVSPFPVELPARLIRAFTFVGETVFDPFLGSGTTLLAAAHLGRNGIGCEINAAFCDLSANRLRTMLSQENNSLPF